MHRPLVHSAEPLLLAAGRSPLRIFRDELQMSKGTLLFWRGLTVLWVAARCPYTIPASGHEYGVRLSRWSVMAFNAAEDEDEDDEENMQS